MTTAVGLTWLIALIPLARAWQRNRGWSIRHAVAWAISAWLIWGWHIATGNALSAYAALVQTACAGVAVLGARRPGVAAWNFVVLGLLVVLWLAAAEGALTGTTLHLGSFRVLFLIGLQFVTVTNYLPTRLGYGAVLLAVASGLATATLLGHGDSAWDGLFASLAPWAAWLNLRRPADRWTDFRDRYGTVWAARVRDQFNAAADNRSLPADLTWNGLVAGTDRRPEMDHILDGLLQRFDDRRTAPDVPPRPATFNP